MKVNEFMTKDVISCHENNTVEEAAKIMVKEGFSVIPVIDDDRNLVGILTESDFVGTKANIPHALVTIKQLFGQVFNLSDIESIYHNAKRKSLSEVMTKRPVTVASNSSLTSLIDTMITKNLKRIPIVSKNELVGIVTRKDLLKAFVKS